MFIYTKHALEKMDGLGLSRHEVEQAILQGMKWKETQSDKWHGQMSGIEVVFIPQEGNYFIITTYLARREK